MVRFSNDSIFFQYMALPDQILDPIAQVNGHPENVSKALPELGEEEDDAHDKDLGYADHQKGLERDIKVEQRVLRKTNL